MKGNVKKILAAALALALVLSVAGCGKDKGLNEDGTYTVVWYNEDMPQKDQQMVIDELNKYTKDKIGVVVDYTAIAPAEFAEKTQLLFSSRKKIDVIYTSSADANYEQNARKSAYYDMGDLLNTVGKPTKDLIPEYALDCFKVGGIQYAIPVLKDWAFQPYFSPKTQMLKDAGMYEKALNATSISDFTEIIDAVSANEKANYGGTFYGILMRGNHNLMKFLPQETIVGSVLAGFEFDNYDTVINVFNTDEAKELFTLLHDWYKKGYIKNDAATSTSDTDLWKIGNFLSGHGEWLPGLASNPDLNTDVKGITTPRMATPQVTATGMAITSTTKNPEKSMEFINLLYNDEYVRNLIGLGIEGIHWIDKGDYWALPEGVETKADTGWESQASRFGNRFILKPQEGQAADINELWQKWNEDAEKSPAIGFTFDPAPVAGQIAAVQNAYNEYMPALLVGAVDPAEALPKAIAAMNSVGAEDIIKEAQRQYDEWKKNK